MWSLISSRSQINFPLIASKVFDPFEVVSNASYKSRLQQADTHSLSKIILAAGEQQLKMAKLVVN